jgi:Xaa-Pro aminopeptidase
MIDLNLYRGRRQRLAEQMGRGVAVLSTAPERLRNRDAHYPFRFDSYFYYLTGFDEPEAMLVLIAGDEVRSLLFCRDKHEEREIWDGFRYGPEAARDAFGFDEAHSNTKLDEMLPQLLADQPAMFCDVGENGDWDARLIQWLNAVRAQVRTGISAPSEIRDIRKLLDEMRLVKDAHELDIMRRAARISANAHRRAMRHARPGLHEYNIEAELLHEFRSHGAQAPAYTPIVAGGANACVLHYVSNDAPLKDGDLLIDAGWSWTARLRHPARFRSTALQRSPARCVPAGAAARAAIAKPARATRQTSRCSGRIACAGFVDLACSGQCRRPDRIRRCRRFCMHRTGHWPRTYDCARQRWTLARTGAGDGADRRAWLLHPARRGRSRAFLEYRRAHRRRRRGNRGRLRDHHLPCAQDHRGHRGADGQIGPDSPGSLRPTCHASPVTVLLSRCIGYGLRNPPCTTW